MKKITLHLLAFALVLSAAGVAVAAVPSPGTIQVDGSLAFATGPDPFDDDFGIMVGAGYMLRDVQNLQARIDLSYFSFDRNVANTNVDYTRIPVTVSGRYYFQATPGINLFTEAGIETSFDDSEFVDVLGVKHSESETHVGFSPGAGGEFYIGRKLSMFALARFHIITDDYFSAHVGAAYHF